MYRNRKRLSFLLLIFFITIITGAVYAATNGTLVFSNSITLARTNTELKVTEHTAYAVSSSGNGYGRYTIDSSGKIVTFEILLTEPGDSVTLYYNLINTGNTNAKFFHSLTRDGAFAMRPYAMSGDHNLNSFNRFNYSSVLAPGAIVENCHIKFDWKSDADNNAEGVYSFDWEIGYVFTTDPATVLP